MIKKRFYYDFEDPNGHRIVDTKTDKSFRLETVGDYRLLTDCMNILWNEIEQLNQSYVLLEDDLDYCQNKIKQCEEELLHMKSDKKQYDIIIKSLKDENQKLKLRLKDLGVEYY